MPWNETTRREYAQHGRRYASDLTDREWALVALSLPARKKIERPRKTDLHDALDDVQSILTYSARWLIDWRRPGLSLRKMAMITEVVSVAVPQ